MTLKATLAEQKAQNDQNKLKEKKKYRKDFSLSFFYFVFSTPAWLRVSTAT